jgi:hypothetical protein
MGRAGRKGQPEDKRDPALWGRKELDRRIRPEPVLICAFGATWDAGPRMTVKKWRRFVPIASEALK